MAVAGLRRIEATAQEVSEELRRLREVRHALEEIGRATNETVAAVESVRTHPAPWAR